jgi:NAD(P)-dependent dehydrogenase (short-subunit alcohol dehydrogenase family)
MDLGLAGRIAVVMGGSRGIGKAVGLGLAREGARVALVARNLPAAQASAQAIARETGAEVEAFSADTGKDADVRAAVAQILARFGGLDILVNCAAQPGGQTRVPALADITDDDFWADMNVKVMGYLRTAREVAPIMKARGWGRIVNVSGLAARRTGSIIGSMRNVSVAALTKNLADEPGPHGINATCVHPGNTRTEGVEALMRKQAAEQGVSFEEIERRMDQRNSIHHLVTPEEVANVIVFLASPRSLAVNGDSIAAGGGAPGAIYY